MSVNSEEKIYNDLMNEVPSKTVSGDTKQSAAALAGQNQQRQDRLTIIKALTAVS